MGKADTEIKEETKVQYGLDAKTEAPTSANKKDLERLRRGESATEKKVEPCCCHLH